MTITVVAVTLFLTLSMRGGRLVPGRWQSLAELSYEFIANMIEKMSVRRGANTFRLYSLYLCLF